MSLTYMTLNCIFNDIIMYNNYPMKYYISIRFENTK